MKKLLMLVVALATLVTGKAVHADYFLNEGFYVGAFGGANWISTSRRSGVDLDFRTGYVVGGVIGYEWCEGFRLEGEISYRHNHLRSFEIADVTFHTHGHFQSWSYMANALYDLPDCWNPLSCYCITPYIGGGIGYSHQRLRISDFTVTSEGRRHGFAWQVIAGFAYEIDPCSEIGLEYRFHKGRAHRIYNHSLDVVIDYHF